MKLTIVACLLTVGAIACDRGKTDAQERSETNREVANAPADNTQKNERDKSGATLTPGDQAENETDRKITQEVRKEVVANDALSMTAKNVKIITSNGVVTLRGPVASPDEKTKIAGIAQTAPGVARVDNQLEVAAK
jgi:hyperosmotically inducible protein